jgi:hypothetical protein
MARYKPIQEGQKCLFTLDLKSREILDKVENKSAFVREAILLKAQHEGIAA